MTKRIKKLLIANRGEIACRVIDTCQQLGIKTVAVYSSADAHALHVKLSDEAVCIGPAAASESYLVANKIIDACKRTGADAVHPGYGFLSENPEFAEALAQNDIIFVGPSADSMRAMALKGAAKKLMEDAGVPVVPGYHGKDQSLETLSAEAEKIGYPVLIKAVAGGGGKGMRKVFAPEELAGAVEAAAREGQNSFGNPELLIEKYIQKPRHIELQVFGDKDGSAVHLFERDCSLQRRHQKVVEEAPAPGMSAEMRRAMGEAAVKAAEAIGYTGAGTVEFIVDVATGLDGAPFYFMEMNTRLQVEHPVTEMITGQDLVEWQIRVAEGAPLPLSQDEINLLVDGHAVEVRLYAEDPFNNFAPAIGRIGLFDPFAPVGPTARIDAGVRAGDEVSIHYDPMIGKLIAWGEDRQRATDALIDLVRQTPVSGLATNRDFLLRCLDHEAFRAGDVHTGFIDTYQDTLLRRPVADTHTVAVAAIAICADRQQQTEDDDPWSIQDTFRLNLPAREALWFDGEDVQVITAHVTTHGAMTAVTVGELTLEATCPHLESDILTFGHNGMRQQFFAEVADTHVTLINGDETLTVKRHDRDSGGDTDADAPGTITAPMPGKILELKVIDGETVERGQPLLVMEAMKMEQTISAPKGGMVKGLTLSPGDQVADGAVLLTVDEN